MFCSKCGSANADDDRFCSQCNTPLQSSSIAVSSPTMFSPTPTATIARPKSAPSSLTLQIPAREELASLLMFWAGHVLALLGWIFAIIIWVQSGKPISDNSFLSSSVGNPLAGFEVGLGFLSFISGHVLQIVFFWASELLKAVRAK